jgi:phosphohistidine swiveling domain-containing protein
MKTLGLPYRTNNSSVLEMLDGELVVNLEVEAATLYESTLFSYSLPWQPTDSLSPKLVIDWKKTVSPRSWTGTAQTLFKQMLWIGQPSRTVAFARQLVDSMPEFQADESSLSELEKKMMELVWPKVIGLGLLSEFFAQLVQQEMKELFPRVQDFVSSQQAHHDWFFKSLADQYLVKSGELSLELYLQEYGLRADQDYELSCPRWYEIPNEVKRRIQDLPTRLNDQQGRMSEWSELSKMWSKNQRAHVEAWLELQTLRSEARRKALEGVDALRRALAPQLQQQKKMTPLLSSKKEIHGKSKVIEGQIFQGVAVSAGVVSGTAKLVERAGDKIPAGSIGIFPAANPEFSGEYLKCVGLIFLQGGQTSHGSIVAREFGLPAVIDVRAAAIKNHQKITLNGLTGQWFVGENDHIFEPSKSRQKHANKQQKSSSSKAHTLAALKAAGLPVPNFFVLSAEQLKQYQRDDWSQTTEQEIFGKFRALDSDTVAVRSSANGEDSASAAWAGQLDSFLNVTTKDLISKVKKCAKSIQNPHLLHYLEHHNLPTKNLRMDVIVQKMIQSEWSGVVFTADPISGDTSAHIIEVVTGLGESLAQGTQAPSRYRIEKKSRQIEVLNSEKSSSKIDESVLLALAGHADQIEQLFGVPQDIEWASQNNHLFILQARPITTV